jgi:predicted MFS family arabinose efflux permease
MPATQTAARAVGGLGPVSVALAGAVAIAVALGVGRFVYTPILPPMAEALRLSKSAAGLIASANFAGYLVGALVATAPRLIGSRRLWVLGALTASAVTTAAMGLAHTLPAFLALRFTGGVASAFLLVIATALVLERLAETGREGLSALHFSGVGGGIALSAALVAAMLALGFGWRALWISSGALSLAALPAVAALPSDRPAPSPTSKPRDRRSARGESAGLGRIVVAYGLFGFGYVITATFLVSIVQANAGLRSFGPVVWIVFGAASAPSVALWTRLAVRLGAARSFALACLVEAAGVVASVALPSLAGVLLAAILVGGTIMPMTALGFAEARVRTTGDPRRVLALMTVAFSVGQIMGPAFAGVVADRLGNFTAASIAAAAALVIAAVLAVWRRNAGSH